MKRIKFLFFALSMTIVLQAQVIRLDFPHFAGKSYTFSLVKADQPEIVQTGSLDGNGQTVLIVPKSHSGYRGISIFRLAEDGGMNIVLNNEKAFLLRCTGMQPEEHNLFFIGSPENNFLLQSYANQQSFLDKYRTMQSAMQLYASQDSLHLVFEQEAKRLEDSYVTQREGREKSPLYAARIREIHHFLMGVGSRLELTKEEAMQELLDFAAKKLDMEVLYTSNLWNTTLEWWMNMQLDRRDDVLLLKDSREMLSRVSSQEIHKVLSNTFAKVYTRVGKNHLLFNLGIDNLLGAGNVAPALVTGQTEYTPDNTLLIFYESGCSNCENELVQLRGNYPAIKEKGYEVISVAADTDRETFEKTADFFPWKEKLCDYQGFDGVNFKNYAIVGTPAIFVIDKEGKIAGRYARLVETKILD